MFKSYLKVAIRNLQKNKLVSFINIFGLGLSMSVGLMIMIRMEDQFSYDRFHPNGDRVYRILSTYSKKTGEQWKMASTPLPLLKKIQAESSLAESSVNLYPAFHGKATASGKEIDLDGFFTESSFFNVFGFSLGEGDPASALEKPNTVVISKNTAERFFGHENPLGKLISLENGTDFMVTGILNEPPGKTHIHGDIFASASSIASMEQKKILPNKSSDWFAFNAAYTYVLLKNKNDAGKLRNELQSFAAELNRINKDGQAEFTTQALSAITPAHQELYNEMSGGSWTKSYVEIGVAFIILLAASFNYTNLTTARALTRAKEVGIRKVTGAKRSQIFLQYVTEAVVLAF